MQVDVKKMATESHCLGDGEELNSKGIQARSILQAVPLLLQSSP